MMIEKDPHWDDLSYHRMADVRYDGGRLRVCFEDGSVADLDAARILPPEAGKPHWGRLRFDAYEITVPTTTGPVETPWSTIRLLSDPAYATFIAQGARDYARRMGERIRGLRRARGLTSRELASRAGIAPNSLSRIERGRHEVALSTLGSLLAAMGYTYADLAPAGEPLAQT